MYTRCGIYDSTLYALNFYQHVNILSGHVFRLRLEIVTIQLHNLRTFIV
jgi:hypothetical protein